MAALDPKAQPCHQLPCLASPSHAGTVLPRAGMAGGKASGRPRFSLFRATRLWLPLEELHTDTVPASAHVHEQ